MSKSRFLPTITVPKIKYPSKGNNPSITSLLPKLNLSAALCGGAAVLIAGLVTAAVLELVVVTIAVPEATTPPGPVGEIDGEPVAVVKDPVPTTAVLNVDNSDARDEERPARAVEADIEALARAVEWEAEALASSVDTEAEALAKAEDIDAETEDAEGFREMPVVVEGTGIGGITGKGIVVVWRKVVVIVDGGEEAAE
ncbi:MAG: hypothetical protein MMC33_000021 [Icmadophila ericetorum]|nr:hypothetical protein [Icmadophila ericetorum]